jgi:predicted small secreted protein
MEPNPAASVISVLDNPLTEFPMTRVTAFAIAALTLFGLAACETVEGAGQDIQQAGATISSTARDAQN